MTAPLSKSLKILLVEDSKTDAILIEKALTKASLDNYQLERADSLTSTLRILGDNEFDVVLLDLSLPDVSGFSGLLSIQNRAPKIPVIILTAYEDEEVALAAVEHGAQDYLFKDKASGPIIKRAMRFAIQRKQFEGVLITRANFDPLTGLANRILFESRLDMALARSKRTKTSLSVFFLDLDLFKQINDTMGHSAGDYILQQVAERLNQSIRSYDTAARFGGDEFALLIDDIENESGCVAIAQKIIEEITKPILFSGKTLNVGVSIGISLCYDGDKTRADLLQEADGAMYAAKQTSGSYFVLHSPEIQKTFSRSKS